MNPEPSKDRAERVRALMWNLRIDAATGEVIRELRQAGVGSIVLKGPALSKLYPPDSSRTWQDGDVWVSPDDVPRAERTLEALGFAPTKDESGLPDWWLEHGSSWAREDDLGKIDLHRRLQGVGVDPRDAWQMLWSRAVELQVGGEPAHKLSDPALALYVTLHATHHGVDDPRGLPHLAAALDALDDGTWREALELAFDLDAVDGLATGLSLLPAGVALSERIQVPATRSVRSALHASSPPPVALGILELSSARGFRRFQILVWKVFPPPGFIRHWWKPAASGAPMLVVGYLYRPVWLLLRAPAGYRAWMAARRSARSSS